MLRFRYEVEELLDTGQAKRSLRAQVVRMKPNVKYVTRPEQSKLAFYAFQLSCPKQFRQIEPEK